MFISKEQVEEFKVAAPGMIYEYMSSAGHLGINGMPMFFSFKYLNKDDTKKVLDMYVKIKKAIENV